MTSAIVFFCHDSRKLDVLTVTASFRVKEYGHIIALVLSLF